MAGEYARAADGWPAADLRLPRRQRHTARRVHERLAARARGFRASIPRCGGGSNGGGRIIAASPTGTRGRRWAPGVTRVGFGPGWGRGRGHGADGAFSGGLVPVLEHAIRGRAARGDHRGACATGRRWCSCIRAWRPGCRCPDDATGVGRRGSDGTVALTRLFSLFRARHGFEARFCNPYSGHEKGRRG